MGTGRMTIGVTVVQDIVSVMFRLQAEKQAKPINETDREKKIRRAHSILKSVLCFLHIAFHL